MVHFQKRATFSHLLVLIGFVTLGPTHLRAGANSFVHWETPPIHPLELTPDGRRLLAVNLPDNRLEVFEVDAGWLTHAGSVFTGLDPVTVRARSNSEAWVLNHISDSISIVDLDTLSVSTHVQVGDEPTDVVFAGSPQRAFVSMSQLNEIWVLDPDNPQSPPTIVSVKGEDPRALATDGSRVYAAFFESGNKTTILSEFEVSAGGPYGGLNPPPNNGAVFEPPLTVGLPSPPTVGMIIRKDAGGAWRDDNGANWSSEISWDLHDHDVAIIDASSLGVTYATDLMNLNMAIATMPSGQVAVVGTEATNHIRFEPNLLGTFVRVNLARFDPNNVTSVGLSDLNPHLDYQSPNVPIAVRSQSLGDPRGLVFNADGTRGYVSGMGSNNLIVIDSSGERIDEVTVGQGPTGVVLDEARSQAFVLNRFEGSISIVDTASHTETVRIPFFDPTPDVVKDGRPHLYDTHKSSGLGQAACASCHPDAKMDQLAWDLGNPAGEMQMFLEICLTFPVPGSCEDFHPMKGPLVTQTLVGIGESPPLHWRGDRGALADFNPTFTDLQAADAVLTEDEMAEFSAFLDTIHFPPSPNRNLDGSLLTTPLSNGGVPQDGANIFSSCSGCHFPGQGFNFGVVVSEFRGDSQSFNVSHLSNMVEKTGFDKTRTDNNRGFGFLHDGHADTLITLLEDPVFGPGGGSEVFTNDAAGDQARFDVAALMLSDIEPRRNVGTLPVVGNQAVFITGPPVDPIEQAKVQELIDIVDVEGIGTLIALIAKGVVNGQNRGFVYAGNGGTFQSDRAAEVHSTNDMWTLGGQGNRLTFTAVPGSNAMRTGVDRDEDGFFDRDELDACSDPADATSTPANPGGNGDADGDGTIDLSDYAAMSACVFAPAGQTSELCACRFDFDKDGDLDMRDFASFQVAFSIP